MMRPGNAISFGCHVRILGASAQRDENLRASCPISARSAAYIKTPAQTASPSSMNVNVSTPAIEADRLTKHYGRSRRGGRHLIQARGRHRSPGCSGGNGAGKTTTIGMIMSLDRADVGPCQSCSAPIWRAMPIAFCTE